MNALKPRSRHLSYLFLSGRRLSERYSTMRFLCLSWTLLVAGCMSDVAHTQPKVQHSRVWVTAPQRNLWSFQRVTTLKNADGRTSPINAHVTRQLQPGEGIVFENGTVVSYDGTVLRVANKPVNSLNAVIDRDGALHNEAFIRNFR
ncbi:MAG: hypothetical protein EOP84_29545 [Verrucomicrobiaceae bacterium]|nr:MAG: hypothetical protein EOP84_29545 [Verrucomicrobiaceae bacterium]